MSRKSRLKRKKFNLSRQEFVELVCKKCGLCKTIGNPLFCYDKMYIEGPKDFIRGIVPKLGEAQTWFNSTKFDSLASFPDDDLQFVLQLSFCAADFCGTTLTTGNNECEYIAGCLAAFRRQIESKEEVKIPKVIIHRGRNKKFDKENKTAWQKEKKVKKAPPTPYFFCNDTFREEVEKIINEVDTGEQHPCAGCPGCTKANVGGATACSGP
jgi:hypothetical protein